MIVESGVVDVLMVVRADSSSTKVAKAVRGAIGWLAVRRQESSLSWHGLGTVHHTSVVWVPVGLGVRACIGGVHGSSVVVRRLTNVV